MDYSQPGHFRGKTNQTTAFDGVTVTETEYDYSFIDWHYHENPYFSLTTFGSCRSTNKKETLVCSPDSLLFNNCQEPHYNSKTDVLTRDFQIEISLDWCRKFNVDLGVLPRGLIIRNPNAKLHFYNVYKESKLNDDVSNLTVDSLLFQIFESMSEIETTRFSANPNWVKKVDEILHDNFDQPLTLQEISSQLDIHRVHLSREFTRYFRCNFSEYVRKIRVEKSLNLLRNNRLTLTEISLMCGFSDQSHFIRCFKNYCKITPKKFRQII